MAKTVLARYYRNKIRNKIKIFSFEDKTIHILQTEMEPKALPNNCISLKKRRT